MADMMATTTDATTDIMRNNAVILDFDGVIFDTAREAYVVAKMAESGCENYREDDIDEREYGIFRKYRYLITKAWNYCCLMEIIDKNIEDRCHFESEYMRSKSLMGVERIEAYERAFFKMRGLLRSKYRKSWLKLHQPFGIVNDLKRILDKHGNNIYVLTTKDKEAVMDLLKMNGIEVDEAKIYGRDCMKGNVTKGSIIKDMMIRQGMEKVLFVDDSSEHVRSCDELSGVETCIAAWGYVAPEERGQHQGEVINRILEHLGD